MLCELYYRGVSSPTPKAALRNPRMNAFAKKVKAAQDLSVWMLRKGNYNKHSLKNGFICN